VLKKTTESRRTWRNTEKTLVNLSGLSALVVKKINHGGMESTENH